MIWVPTRALLTDGSCEQLIVNSTVPSITRCARARPRSERLAAFGFTSKYPRPRAAGGGVGGAPRAAVQEMTGHGSFSRAAPRAPPLPPGFAAPRICARPLRARAGPAEGKSGASRGTPGGRAVFPSFSAGGAWLRRMRRAAGFRAAGAPKSRARGAAGAPQRYGDGEEKRGGGGEGERGGARGSAGERGRRSWGAQHREQGALLRGRSGTRERDTTRTAAARAAGAPPPCRACRRSSACFPTSSAR